MELVYKNERDIIRELYDNKLYQQCVEKCILAIENIKKCKKWIKNKLLKNIISEKENRRVNRDIKYMAYVCYHYLAVCGQKTNNIKMFLDNSKKMMKYSYGVDGWIHDGLLLLKQAYNQQNPVRYENKITRINKLISDIND